MTDQNLTLRIDAQVLLWARMRALRDGTSINRRIRHYLEEYAAIPPDQRWPSDEHAAAAARAEASPFITPWPDVEPGAAGNPGGPGDHTTLWGSDGHRVSISAVVRDRRREAELRRNRQR